jgi:hypothetical protein
VNVIQKTLRSTHLLYSRLQSGETERLKPHSSRSTFIGTTEVVPFPVFLRSLTILKVAV